MLDRQRPLWEFHLIEGLSDRRFAFYTKIHHALADGVTLSRWFSESGSEDPEDFSSPAIWHGEKDMQEHEGREPTYANLIGEGIRVFGGGIRTALDMTTLTMRLINRRYFEKNRAITLPLSASKTPLNVVPGAARYLTATTFSLDDVKSIARKQAVSINDVLLTMCDLAINRYFAEKGAPLENPLVVYMPVNLRSKGETKSGNLVSLLQVRLASEKDDPLGALQQIRKSSIAAREVFSGFGKPAIQLYSLTVALLSLFEESLKLDKILPPVQNLVISNVPGPPKTLYFRGAEGLNAYPISTLPPMTALNVTANSYAGVLHVGMVAGRTAIPDLDKLTAHMEAVFGELLEQA
jgi:diacylglycerol O-acyltransferase